MRTYKVKIPTTVSITWSQELVENQDNFYIRLTPHINLGGIKGADRLARVQTGTVSRYVLKSAQDKLLKETKKDKSFLKEVKDAMKGKQVTQVQIKEPIKAREPDYISRLEKEYADDIALGASLRDEQETDSSRILSTGWSERDLKKYEKGE